MKITFTKILFASALLVFTACNGGQSGKKSSNTHPKHHYNYANYNIQVVTYHTKPGVNMQEFKKIDSLMEQVYTSKQPGYISRESGIDQKGNWLVVVSYDTEADAMIAYNHFKTSPQATDFRSRIDTASLNLQNFLVKDDHSTSLKDKKPFVIEVATFRTLPGVNRDTFQKRDMEIENNYMSSEDGYITRKTGTSTTGEQLMIVYWKTIADADHGIDQFFKDRSVADYTKMVDPASVKLQRFKAVY